METGMRPDNYRRGVEPTKKALTSKRKGYAYSNVKKNCNMKSNSV